MASKAKKQCPIDALGIKHIDYKDTALLKQYLTKFNRIIPRYYSGVSLANQKRLAAAIKRARYMALLPYVLDVPRPNGNQIIPSAPSAAMIDEAAVAV